MAGETVFFVQFPHPGPEHNPPTGDMHWNTHNHHHRKFLIAPGRYLDGDRRIRETELVFWGEWEPPSRVERRWPASGRLPRALHRPYWADPASEGFRQNTDPWVFGDRMLYSNCRQLTSQRRPNSMQHLTPGSVICFGSTIQGEFCLDTVFVVASAERWTPAGAADLDVDDAFKVCTAHSLMTKKGDAYLPLTLYRGATVDDPVEGMFSFVPASRANVDGPRFERPPLRLTGFIDPSVWRSTWGSTCQRPLATVRGAWETVRRQVLDRDHLLLAVWLQSPDRGAHDVAVPESSRQRC